jgi:hypothetical protein
LSAIDNPPLFSYQKQVNRVARREFQVSIVATSCMIGGGPADLVQDPQSEHERYIAAAGGMGGTVAMLAAATVLWHTGHADIIREQIDGKTGR